MKDDKSPLAYADEHDRSYGIAGMTLSLVVTEDEPPFDSVSLDADAGSAVVISDTYIHSGSTVASVRGVYHGLLHHFELYMRMVIANVMARHYVRKRKDISPEARHAMLASLERHGAEECSLDTDEVRGMFDNEYNYMYRVFNHPSVAQAVNKFVGVLDKRRTLSRHEVIDILSVLNR